MRIEALDDRYVWRDDLRPGGSKAAVLPQFLERGKAYAYAGPCEGYAQLALAISARRSGAKAHLFCAARKQRHAITSEAASHGARLHEIRPGYLSCVRKAAVEFCRSGGVSLLPFGLAFPEFEAALADYARTVDCKPPEVWVAAGSGTLSRALAKAFPKARIIAVAVGREPSCGGARVIKAPEPFAAPAKQPPPFPSCAHYDAKVWQFFSTRAAPGALFWNVAA